MQRFTNGEVRTPFYQQPGEENKKNYIWIWWRKKRLKKKTTNKNHLFVHMFFPSQLCCNIFFACKTWWSTWRLQDSWTGNLRSVSEDFLVAWNTWIFGEEKRGEGGGMDRYIPYQLGVHPWKMGGAWWLEGDPAGPFGIRSILMLVSRRSRWFWGIFSNLPKDSWKTWSGQRIDFLDDTLELSLGNLWIQLIILYHHSNESWDTLPETNIDPENRPLEKDIPIGNHPF